MQVVTLRCIHGVVTLLVIDNLENVGIGLVCEIGKPKIRPVIEVQERQSLSWNVLGDAMMAQTGFCKKKNTREQIFRWTTSFVYLELCLVQI